MIEQAVQKILEADPVIDAALPAQSVHIAERPQTFGLPAVVITRGGAEPLSTLKSTLKTRRGFVVVNVLARSYLVAQDLARFVSDALHGFSGNVDVKLDNDQTQTVRIQRLLHDDETDLPSDHRDGQDQIATHAIALNFRTTFAPINTPD